MSAFTHDLGQVTYPRMERQDLTQGQLGSFKFVPTDEVRPAFSGFSPRLSHRSTKPYGIDTKIGSQFSNTYDILHNASLTRDPPASASSPTRIKPTFFDNFIKPDLDRSPLRFGPGNLRTAVDGAPSSPQKRTAGPGNLSPSYNNTLLNPNMSAQNLDNSPFPTFTPMASSGAQSDMNLLHVSLIRALATEQHAHQATKSALEAERSERLKAENEAQRYLEHNRSLIGSVNMLKSVIQHNMKQQEEAVLKDEDRFYKGIEAAEPNQTILHDAVKNLKTPSKPSDVSEALTASNAGVSVDSNHLFDFDLLDKLGPAALRRHFSSQATTQEARSDNSTEGVQLVSVSPQKPVVREKSDETWKSSDATLNESPVELNIVLKSTKPKVESGNGPKLMAMPFDPQVQWSQEPIFDDREDKFNRLGHHGSIFADHPVRYHPNKSDKNLYRTVMIDFIPLGTVFKDLLGQVHGGSVESIQLYGPVGSANTFMTARIVFTYELSARGVYLYGQTPGIWIQGERVRVWQVLEPTYPRTEDLVHKIFDDGFTRCLLIATADKSALDKLPKKLARQIQAGFVVEIGTTHDGLPVIEFTSIAEASKALDQLMHDIDFKGSQFDFDEDPCNDPYPITIVAA